MSTTPFRREVDVDEPSIVGARWWNKSVQAATTRRHVLTAFVLGGAGLAVGSAILAIAKSGGPDERVEPKSSLTMQRDYGWSFGAESELLVYSAGEPADPAVWTDLVATLEPKRALYHPHYVATLFEVPPATPRLGRLEGSSPANPFQNSAQGSSDAASDNAFQAGSFLASKVGPKAGLALVVDLPGPQAAAFAAGAAGVFDPVFLFDNWPHPRGVVAAHETIGVIAHFHPHFVRTRVARGDAPPPMFVLDRNRLAPYVDDDAKFDNRHLAKVPGAAELSKLGVTDILYVAPGSSDLELDDLNDLLCDLVGRVRLFRTSLLQAAARDDAFDPLSSPWTPVRRTTPFSRTSPPPVHFGTVPVAIAIGTGIIIGSRLARSGSWNRSSGGSTGGG